MILTVNAGSSSVRLAAFKQEQGTLFRVADAHRSIDEGGRGDLFRDFLEKIGADGVSAVSHRVVHGGTSLVKSCIVGPEEESQIERLSSLAPLHNPPALNLIRVARDALGESVPQIAVFDTALYADMPDVAKTYALPMDLCAEHGIRRYGFHGLAHKAMWLRWSELRPEAHGMGKVITLQLGAGCSITAFKDGAAVDTTMGFSPLEGLVMATRSGDVDPEVVLYLQREANMSGEEIDAMLNESSGLLGVSGVSTDMRKLLESGEPRSRLAVDLYCYRARKYIGAFMAVLGGIDTVLFGGGVAENSPRVRERILSGFYWYGMGIDMDANSSAIGIEAHISSRDSRSDIWVLPVDEALLLAREAAALLGKTK